MLNEESLWIGKKIKTITETKSFPILNIGSSTKEYRTVKQSFIQKNIFDLIPDETRNVVHLDMKAAEGVDLVGNLHDQAFLEEIKQYKVKTILLNNVLMYLEDKERQALCHSLDEILEKNGYIIVTNSHVFPPAHDPVESYYRASPENIHQELFPNYKLLDTEITSTYYTYAKYLKANPKVLPVKIARFFLPFYKYKEWKFMLNYYINNLNKNYSASCIFLQKN